MVGVTGFTDVCCAIMLKYGGVSEWFMEMVLKTIDRKVRGFESLPLRRRSLSDRYDPVGRESEVEYSIGADVQMPPQPAA